MDCCTFWFEGWWSKECCEHDKIYTRSGVSRKKGDYLLYIGVLNNLSERVPKDKWYTSSLRYISYIPSFPIASVMWIGVRVGGKNRYERKQKLGIRV